jgi:hypothetical protein
LDNRDARGVLGQHRGAEPAGVIVRCKAMGAQAEKGLAPALRRLDDQ